MDEETSDKLKTILIKLDTNTHKFPGMSYEDGINELAMWLLGDITDEEFEYSA